MSTNLLNQSQVRGEFSRQLTLASNVGLLSRVALEVKSDVETDVYALVSRVPKARKWLGPRQLKNIMAVRQNIRNEPWDTSVQIPLLDFQRDQTLQLSRRLGDLAVELMVNKWRLVTDLIKNNTATGYDGQVLFHASHTFGNSGAQTNLITATECPALNVATASSPTPEEAVEAIMQVIGFMQGNKDDEGEPFMQDSREWLLLFPQDLAGTFRIALNANNLAGGETNPVSGSFDGMRITGAMETRLYSSATGNTVFYVISTDGGANKPFIVQNENGPNATAVGPGSEWALFNNTVALLGDWRGGVGVGEPLRIAKCTLS